MRPARSSRCGLWGLLVFAGLLAGFPQHEAPGAVVTRRLETGLTPSGGTDDLPQAWAAAVAIAPVLDGRLDEKVWSATRPMVLGELERYGEARPRTEARFVHHAGVLYLGARLAEPNAGALRRAAKGHDAPAWQDDSLELFLAPDPHRAYFQVVLSASGAVFDRRGHGEPSGWDAGAKTAVATTNEGWSLEAALPLAAFGAGPTPPERWRVNVYRNRYAGGKGENQAWSPTYRGEYDVPERFGRLLFTPQAPWARQQPTGAKGDIAIEDLGDGQAVLRFDLAAGPETMSGSTK